LSEGRRTDDEVADLDVADAGADLLDDADVLVAHRGRAVDADDPATTTTWLEHVADDQYDAG
jgi:hypothetical protein